MRSVISFVASLSLVYYFLFPQHALAQGFDLSETLVFVRDPELLAAFEADREAAARMAAEAPAGPAKKLWRVITAYSSTRDQTDSTPFVTAAGTRVRDGVMAANFLAFGTKARIPALFGDKVFTVEDRMNARYPNRVDIWFASRAEARAFGARAAEIEILPN